MQRKISFNSIKSEGGLLPPDLLSKIVAGDRSIPGLSAENYHLEKDERVNEAISRSFVALLSRWRAFKSEMQNLPKSDLGTGFTREKWLLPLFQELGYGRLINQKADEIDGKTYPISHLWNHTPIHLVGFRIDIDKKASGVAGASRLSPHGLLQEYLNRCPDKLWGIVSNGFKLRILRDSVSLTRQSYLEFDLESIFEGEAFSDFSVLWLVAHQSRVESEKPEECQLEKWTQLAKEQGTRALDTLRQGVESAIKDFGEGFLTHPKNIELRAALSSGKLSAIDYYRELLRLIYRLIFLFAAEDRDLLHTTATPIKTKELYQKYYSTRRLRNLSSKLYGSRHTDLYIGLKLIFDKLGGEGSPELGLTPLGSFLWSKEATTNIANCCIENSYLLSAIRSLSTIEENRTRRSVDYRNLGAEELGSIYEALLELHPVINSGKNSFELSTAQGNERKTTGSYYTPTSLINCLLDSALNPVIDEAQKKDPTEKGILHLKICDPACGSGHFLIAAAHRLAKRLASIRSGDDEPSPGDVTHALRDVIGHCIYGVDINPMAVELCKVGLWLEALEPGKPLSFLDHRILCGNSLLGTTPALLAKGIPNEAFEAIEGDDKKVCSALKKRNKEERETSSRKQVTMFDSFEAWDKLGNIAAWVNTLDNIDDSSIEGIRKKQRIYEEQVRDKNYLFSRFWADAFCAAFVWEKKDIRAEALTEEVFRRIEKNPNTVSPFIQKEVARLAAEHKFFHWHLAFPDVFRIPKKGEKAENEAQGWSGGFNCVLGNPPWERIKIQEKEWFAERSPEIANAPNAAARSRLIKLLEEGDSELYLAFLADSRRAEGESHFIRQSERYPLCGRGDVNTYTIFAETNRQIISKSGRVGCIVPSGIATDDTTKFFFQDLVEKDHLRSLFDFENRAAIFEGVHRSFKFSLLTLSGAPTRVDAGAEFIFFAQSVSELSDTNRRFTLAAEDIALVNPNTKTCPIFRTRRDADITKAIYKRVPVLIREGEKEENPWGIKFSTMFHMSSDSQLFRAREDLEKVGCNLKGSVYEKKGEERFLPLYEAKMVALWNHRAADVIRSESAQIRQAQPSYLEESELFNIDRVVVPLYWVSESEVLQRIPSGYTAQWLLGFGNVTSSTNERTLVPTAIPLVAVGHSFQLIFTAYSREFPFFLANLCSFACDYVVRQKLGGVNLSFFVLKQIPVLPPPTATELCPWDHSETILNWVTRKVIELVYNAVDMAGFASFFSETDSPRSWVEDNREKHMASLNACFFHLYRIARDELDYIMETFPIVKRKDEAKYGDYRTKLMILREYDKMAAAMSKSGSAKPADEARA